MKHTPLYNEHVARKGLISDYGDWELPSVFSSIIEEFTAAHTSSIICDCSAIGKFTIKGKGAEQFLRSLLVSSMDDVLPQTLMQSCLCNDYGGTIDIVYIYRIEDNEYLLTGTEHTREKLHRWLHTHQNGDIDVVDISDDIAIIECVGPLSQQVLSDIFPEINSKQLQVNSLTQLMFNGKPMIAAHTHFAGLPCYKLIIPGSSAPLLWNQLLSRTQNFGILPAGMEARKLITIEKGYPVYGHELSDSISPIEAGLSFLISSKDEYTGHEILRKNALSAPIRTIMHFEYAGTTIVENKTPVVSNTTDIGYVTRSAKSNIKGKVIGIAMINMPLPKNNDIITIPGVKGPVTLRRIIHGNK